MRCPAPEPRRRRAAGWIAGALLVLATAPAGAHVFLRLGTQPAYSDAPVEVFLDYLDTCDGPAPNSSDGEHFAFSGPTPGGVIVVPFGPSGVTCNEFRPILNASVPAIMGPLSAGEYRIEVRSTEDEQETLLAYTTFQVYDRPPCRPSASELCLHGGRFGARATWEDFAGGEGQAHAVQRDPAVPFLADTGFLWFFAPDNLELMIKVLDGCALNGNYWVFISPGSTVEYSIEVTDHVAGLTRTFANPSGAVPSLFADTSAFPCR